MKRKQFFLRLMTVLIFVFMILLGIWNGMTNASFWAASAAQWISPIITLLLSYMSVQWKTDQRSIRSHAEKALGQLRDAVLSPDFFRIRSDEPSAERTARLERMQYSVTLLQEYGKRLGFTRDAAFIERQFREYRYLLEEHRDDPDYLAKSEAMLHRYSESICRLCDRIVFSLHD